MSIFRTCLLTKMWRTIAIVCAISLMIIVVGWYTFYNASTYENKVLVIWEGVDETCTIHFIYPDSKKQYSHNIQSDCNLVSYNLENKTYIVDVSNHEEFIIYELIAPTQLSFKNKINLGQVKITSPLQFDQFGTIYFSGIFQQKERIYKVNTQTNQITQIPLDTSGMAYDPIISPDGTFLAYLVSEDVLNRYECVDFCEGHYYVFNLNDQTNVDLSLIGQQAITSFPQNSQCQGSWDTQSSYFAIKTGCYHDNQVVLLFDIKEYQFLSILPPADMSLPLLDLQGWFDNKQILYETPARILPDDPPTRRLYLYSIFADHSAELHFIPYLTSWGTPFSLTKIALAQDGTQFAGTFYGETGKPEIVLFDIEKEHLTYTRLIGFEPSWSINSELVAFNTGKGVAIINNLGEMIYTWNSKLEGQTYDFVWITAQ